MSAPSMKLNFKFGQILLYCNKVFQVGHEVIHPSEIETVDRSAFRGKITRPNQHGVSGRQCIAWRKTNSRFSGITLVAVSLTSLWLKRWRLFHMMGYMAVFVWFTSLSLTYVSHCSNQTYSMCPHCVCHCCAHNLSATHDNEIAVLYERVPPSLHLLGSMIKHMTQMTSVHVSSFHVDAHLCPVSSRWIPWIPLNKRSHLRIKCHPSTKSCCAIRQANSTAVSLHLSIVLFMGLVNSNRWECTFWLVSSA